MDATGYDTESTTAVVSGGSQMVLFTTGRGNPFGFPTVPVMKIASTTQLYERMKDDMDINAGKIVEGTSIEDLGAEIFEEMIAVANGKNKARRKRHNGDNEYLLHNPFTVNIL